MPTIEDHSYLKICAQLASCLSISLAAARRKIELAAASQGIKELSERKSLAENLLKEALQTCKNGNSEASSQFDSLLVALAEEENFMTED
tara:strand:+ start:289 stop:558 length:270 start_codon:yes stop_codon:yes gene_type:complete